MPKTKKHHAEISQGMHYAVVLALVISLITTFLLGMLLTETLWGGGLNYFHTIGNQTKVQKSQAAVHIQRNGNRFERPPSIPGPIMRTVTYYGTVTSVMDDYDQLSSDVYIGAPMTVTTTFEDDPMYVGVEGAEWGNYYTDGRAIVTVGSSKWDVGSSSFVVHNAVPPLEYIAFQNEDGGLLANPYYLLAQASWENNTDVFSSSGIPESLNTATDSSNQYEFNLYYNQMYSPEFGDPWSIVGTVDQVVFR